MTDNNGALVNQDVTVTITGTNDAPTIVGASTVATGGVTEDTNVVVRQPGDRRIPSRSRTST